MMAKKVCAVLLIVSLFISLVPIGVSQAAAASQCINPVIANPGFEEPAENAIPGWQFYGPAQQPGYSVQVTQEKAYSGTSSAMMDKSGTANSLGIITDRFEVAAGCTYAASARLNLEYGGTMI